MLEHMLDWIGPILVLIVSTVAVAVVRTITNSNRITRLESDMEKVEELPGKFDALNQRCATRCTTDKERSDRNDAAHTRIEKHMEKSDEKIEEARQERHREIQQLKDDLIREFRKSNGR